MIVAFVIGALIGYGEGLRRRRRAFVDGFVIGFADGLQEILTPDREAKP